MPEEEMMLFYGHLTVIIFEEDCEKALKLWVLLKTSEL